MCDLKRYIADHYLDVYLEDAINKVMQSENRIDHVEDYLKEYFSKVNSGEHVLNADGRYILASPYNRACVVRQLRSALDPFNDCIDTQLSKGDFCSIIELTWPHWDSRGFVQKSMLRFLDRSQTTYPVDDFIRAFSLSILYEEAVPGFRILRGVVLFLHTLAAIICSFSPIADFLREADKILLSNKSYSRNRIFYKLKEKRSQIEDLKSLWPDRSVVEEVFTDDCSFEEFNRKLFQVANRADFIDTLCEST
ncbi:UPF0705 protein C11orf49-like [Tropilaelaps mercedesae]|uniref:Centriolar satellite-associated tubulin polyglutamylase complex regulator 1 n=1 Tax=Tropilaelaps mercedesae TaxID=418985 RepID=A0A1V9XK63_9ACAR|nr:UPF0705 protein C11orf49-like [Tropilaelaps mercedesae]